MLIRLPPETSLTTPSRGLPLLMISTPGPLPPLRERTEPFLSRSAGIAWRLGARAPASRPAARRPLAAERRSELAPERVSRASTAGDVHSAPASTFAFAEVTAAESAPSAARVPAWLDAADA